MADAGVSMEARARLPSHRLSRVQDRHYHMHECLDEMRAPLETLHRLPTGTGASIVPITRKRTR
ncbi:MAG: hypothetical protein J0H27_06315 [Xanthomonadales bacterium]|nr:hypothetical protein [Xanthomonadales bacterium]